MFRAAFFSFILIFYPLGLFSQHAWAFRTYPGFLAAHHEDMQAMSSHSLAFEVAREWKLDSAGWLAKNQRNPYVGIGAGFMGLFKHINGNVLSGFAYYDAGISGNDKTSLRVRMATGMGYLTKEWDPFLNNKNRAIGSHLNGMMQLAFYIETRMAKSAKLQAGLTLIHFSNGNWSMPNLGINMPSIFLGLKQPDNNRKFYNSVEKPDWKKSELQFSARLGKRQMSMDDPKNIVNYLLEAKYFYPHKPHRYWTCGLVYYYDRTYVYHKFHPLPAAPIAKTSEIAITGGHEYRVGRVALVADMGFYLYRPDQTKRKYFEALGIKYYAGKNLVIMSRLKAHLTSADYFEWGLAWQFKTKETVTPGIKGGLRWLGNGLREPN
jgi:hypothetical protein